MTRVMVIAAALLFSLGGVAFALTRPDVPSPGPPVFLDATPGTGTAELPTPNPAHRAGDADKDDDASLDRDDDGFRVATPRAVKADDDWDDDWDDDHDDDRDDDDRDDDHDDD